MHKLITTFLVSYLFGIGCVVAAGNFGPYFLIEALPATLIIFIPPLASWFITRKTNDSAPVKAALVWGSIFLGIQIIGHRLV
jgi:FtsH-binding integral membrane protein